MGTNIENRPAKIREIQEGYGLLPLARPGSGDAVVLASANSKGDKRFGAIPVSQRESPPMELALAGRIEEPLISLKDQENAIEGVRGIVEKRDESQRNAIGSFFRAVTEIILNPSYERRVVDTTEYKGSSAKPRIVKTTREETSQPVLPKKAELKITEEPAKIEVRKSVTIGEMTTTTYRDGTVVTEILAPLQQQVRMVSYESSTNDQKGTNEELTLTMHGHAAFIEETLAVNSGSHGIIMSFEYD